MREKGTRGLTTTYGTVRRKTGGITRKAPPSSANVSEVPYVLIAEKGVVTKAQNPPWDSLLQAIGHAGIVWHVSRVRIIFLGRM